MSDHYLQPPGRHRPTPLPDMTPSGRYQEPRFPDAAPVVHQTPEQSPNSLRKKITGVALAAIATAGVIGVAVHRGETEQVSASTHTAEIEKTPTLLERLYQDSEVQEQDHPFPALSVVGRELMAAEEERVVKEALDQQQAEFITAVELSSGIQVNMYSSKLDDKREPFSVDVRALDVLMTELISQADRVPNSPISQQIATLKKQADRGVLKLNLSVVMVSDESLCLGGPANPAEDLAKSRTLIPRTSADGVTQRCSGGINSRIIASNQSTPALNQFVMALDIGESSPRSYYSSEVQAKNQVLTPDQMAAVMLSHELGHALFGSTDQNGALNSDQEHAQFVYPLESQMFGYFCDLNKQPDSKPELVTPVHVDDPVTASAGR